MYFVDREKIEETLDFMEVQLEQLYGQGRWETPIEKAALERFAQTVIESILDAGNAMIDGFIMRDPGSYDDIIDILWDEKVIDDSQKEELKKVVYCRKMLVQQYTTVEHGEVLRVFGDCREALRRFAPAVREYLNTQLGPVSAFRK